MIKIFIKFLLFFYSVSSLAQNTQFIYEYKYIKDTLNINKISKEKMILNVDEKQSDFYSYETYKIDSTIAFLKESGKYFLPPNAQTLNWRVHKDMNNNEILYFNNITYTYYCANQILNFDWKISPEKQRIQNFDVQKATVLFGGRKWTAWFSTDIVVPDGPYKFHGLPGLILKIYDESHSHTFELIGISNKNENFKYPIVYKFSKKAKISIDNYNKIYKNYRKNPLNNAFEFFDFYDSDGNFVSAAQARREFATFQKKIIEKDNNIIEINLLK